VTHQKAGPKIGDHPLGAIDGGGLGKLATILRPIKMESRR
jgi:hypothetical protein